MFSEALKSRNNISPQYGCFIPNENGGRKCRLKASGGEEILIVVRPADLFPLSVSVKGDHEWTPVEQPNLPIELQQGFSPALETLIKVSVFTVSRLLNGTYQLELEAGKNEEIEIEVSKDEQGSKLIRAAERQLQEQQLLSMLLPSIEQKLSVPMNHFALTPAADVLSDLLPIGSVGAAGAIAAGAGVAMTAATGGIMLVPALCISVVLTAGIIIATGIAVYIDDKKKLADQVTSLFSDVENSFMVAYKAYVEQNEPAVIDAINGIITKVSKLKLIKQHSARVFEFDEAGFKNIATLYSTNDKASVLTMMKLIILFSVQMLPIHLCPSAAVLECLENIDTNLVPDNLREYILIAKGRLNLNRGDRVSARNNFQQIGENSILYAIAREYLDVINRVEQQPALK